MYPIAIDAWPPNFDPLGKHVTMREDYRQEVDESDHVASTSSRKHITYNKMHFDVNSGLLYTLYQGVRQLSTVRCNE